MPIPAVTLPGPGSRRGKSIAEPGDQPVQGSRRTMSGAGCPAGGQHVVVARQARLPIRADHGNRSDGVSAERPVAPVALAHPEGMSGDVVATAVDSARH